jgi:ferritin-like metal-binding protein YciE
MPDETPARDAKLIQYLNEAYGKEKELETSLQAHIRMATRPPYKKRLQDHLKETKAQSKGLQRRIKQLGGKAETLDLPGPDVASDAAGVVTAVASKAVAAAKGPLHAVRGTGEAEKMLKNAKTELWNEHEEIGNYLSIETLAESLGDQETARLARDFRRQEERMAAFLVRLIPQLTKAVVAEEIPRSERRPATPATRPRRPAQRASAAPATQARRTSPRTAASRATGGARGRGTRGRASS